MEAPSIPKDFEYTKPSPLPATTRCQSLVAVPLQGVGSATSGFSDGSQLTFALQQGENMFLVPNSMYISATIGFTKTASVDTYVLGVPAYSWVNRVDCQLNSQIIESITNYNALATMLVNSKCSIADKVGLSYMLGLNSSGNADPTFANMDGAYFNDATTRADLQISAPLGCCFSNAEKFVPLGRMDPRITLTVEALANFVAIASGSVSGLSVYNVSLHYDVISFDDLTARMIIDSQADSFGDLYVKTQSYQVSSAPLVAGSAINVEIPYACSLTSIKSLLTLYTANVRNKNFSSFDATGGNGSVQYTVAGRPFPETPILTNIRRPQVVAEFLSAVWGTKDPLIGAKCSLGYDVFRTDAGASTDSYINASKSYFGVSTERVSHGNALLTGVSSQNSNVTLRLQNNNAGGNTNALNAMLIINYDLLIKINVPTKQVSTLR